MGTGTPLVRLITQLANGNPFFPLDPRVARKRLVDTDDELGIS